MIERLPNGEHAWLRPEAEPALTPRSDWPSFIVETQTRYQGSAPTADRVRQWFADESDSDLDVVTIDFGTVRVRLDDGCSKPGSAFQRFAAVCQLVLALARCRARHMTESAPDCAQREQWSVS